MKKRIAQFTIALAAIAMLSACIVINTTEEPSGFAQPGAASAE
ncbi:MAG: hypothetical protein ACFE0P_08625 [Oceanicaulis sp.]